MDEKMLPAAPAEGGEKDAAAAKEITDSHGGQRPPRNDGDEDAAPAEDDPAEAAAQAQLMRWEAEAAETEKRFPGFDLALEAQNADFRALLRAGAPMAAAYAALHWEELLSGAVRAAAAITEKRVVDDLRARGRRPAEAGLGGQSAALGRTDVSRLTRQERADIARRAARGERVTF